MELHTDRLARMRSSPAAQRVLRKCGFSYVGETVDPEDGTVCRFERVVGEE